MELNEQEEQIREQKLRLRVAVRRLAKTSEGQDFLRWLIDECGVFQQDFPRDDKVTAWRAGRREIGLEIFGLCAAEKILPAIIRPEVFE